MRKTASGRGTASTARQSRAARVAATHLVRAQLQHPEHVLDLEVEALNLQASDTARVNTALRTCRRRRSCASLRKVFCHVLTAPLPALPRPSQILCGASVLLKPFSSIVTSLLPGERGYSLGGKDGLVILFFEGNAKEAGGKVERAVQHPVPVTRVRQ